MKPKADLRHFLLAAGISLLPISSASAATRTWGGGNLFWTNTTATGWNAAAPLDADTAIINSGTVTFAANDTYGNAADGNSAAVIINTGGTVASGGRFNLLWNLRLGGGTLLSNGGVNSSYGTFNLAGTVTADGGLTSAISTGTGSNNIINLGNGSSTAVTNTTFNVGVGGTLNVGTVLQNHRYESGGTQVSTAGLIKNGDGLMNLNAANTYTGATTINAGTLLVNGTHIITTGSNIYTVSNSGSTLGGNGRIAINGAITVASTATLAPGASIGTLTLDGANVTGNVLTMSTGSNFGFELDGSGGISDQLALWNYLSGDVVLNNNTLNLSLLGTQAAGTYNVDIFRFFSNAGTTSTTHAFGSGLTIGTLGTGISTASIDWNGTGDNSQSIALTYTVIPEPSVALISSLGLLALLRRRRN